jgi:hypothetical protein
MWHALNWRTIWHMLYMAESFKTGGNDKTVDGWNNPPRLAEDWGHMIKHRTRGWAKGLGPFLWHIHKTLDLNNMRTILLTRDICMVYW